eukprot:COSAG05_NODE_921_length_6590_cov_2.081985_6_plen_72_part_00
MLLALGMYLPDLLSACATMVSQRQASSEEFGPEVYTNYGHGCIIGVQAMKGHSATRIIFVAVNAKATVATV